MSTTARQFLIPILGLLLTTAPAEAQQLLHNKANYDTTPTYDNSGQVVEPDVLYVPGGWNGYHYWMAVTPYTCSNETHENPSILASDDGHTWIAPTTNPIVPYPSDCDYYSGINNDPSIAIVDNVLYLYYMVEYRHGCPTCADSINVFRISSTDGVNWSSPETLVWGDAQLHQEPNYKLSQSVVYKDGTWYMWYVDYPGCSSQAIIHRMSSADGVHWPMANNVACSDSNQVGYPFHLTVKYQAGSYEMLYTNCSFDNLYYATSSNGTSWTSLTTPVMRPGSGSAWDNRVIYRSGFVGKYPNLAVFYNGSSTSTCSTCAGSSYTWHEALADTGDFIPPATTANLDLKRATTSSVTMRWTAPGDDENSGGHATSYSIRSSTSPINDGNWYQATPLSNPPVPSNPGVTDTVKVTGLSSGVWYYFALKTTDDVGNESGLSNVFCIKLGHFISICDGGGFAMRPVDGGTPDSPNQLALAIESVQPNPARYGVDVSYSLPSNVPTTLELIDVAGRMLLRTSIDGNAGAHVAHFDLRQTTAQGMAFLRLRQGAATVSRPIVLLH